MWYLNPSAFEIRFETSQSKSHLEPEQWLFVINLFVFLPDRFSNQSDRSNFSQSISDGLALFLKYV